MKTVAITGASGFIGRHVARHLQQRDVEVVGIVRREESARLLPRGTRPVVVTSLGDHAKLRRALAGVDTIVHLAARVHMTNERGQEGADEYTAANVRGTAAVTVCAPESVEHILYMSSVSAIGEAQSITDETAPNPITEYGKSKYAAEGILEEFAIRTGVVATVLRPPGIYGPGLKGNLRTLMHLVRRGFPIPVSAPAPMRSFLAVENLLAAVDFALARPPRGFRSYMVSDERPLSARELLELVGLAVGRRPRAVSIPERLITGADWFAAKVAAITNLPVPAAIARTQRNLVVTPTRLLSEGWRAPADPIDGWKAVGVWFRNCKGQS